MKPKLRIQPTYSPILTPETKMAADAFFGKYIKQSKDKLAADTLAWSTNLVSDKRYRLCPCGCGLVFMNRHNKGQHIDPAELIADWQDDEADERLEDVDLEAVYRAPVEVPLKPAVSQAQVSWARDMIAQYPRKSQEQICRENGGITWAQLEHYARTPLTGLPERKGPKVPTAKSPAKAPAAKPGKPKATAKKVKGT
jgi:hypothetical protein